MTQEAPGYQPTKMEEAEACIEGIDWEEEPKKKKVVEREASCY